MLKLFTVNVKSLIDDPLPVWYKKIKTCLEQIHYIPNVIVTIIEKKKLILTPSPPQTLMVLSCFYM